MKHSIRAIVAIAAMGAFVQPALPASLSLTEMIVNENLKAGVPYDVALRYEGDPSGVRELCFLWSGEGPFCWTSFRVDERRKLIRTQARTGNPNTYTLAGFARLNGGAQTNRVQKRIKVAR